MRNDSTSMFKRVPEDEQALWELPYRQDDAIYRVQVTPALATRWMENNRDNRFVRPRYLKKYTQQMKAGNWVINGECIKFARTGKLLDGQHRLLAVIAANATVELEVRVGLPEDASLTVDTGTIRTATDVMSMHGMTQWESSVLAGAIRLLINHEQVGSMWAQYRADNREVEDYFTAHQSLHLSMQCIKSRNNARSRLYPFPLAVALHYLFAQVNENDADDFFYRLYHGVGINSDEPLHWLRRYRETSHDKMSYTRQTYDLAIRTVKCWNLTRRGIVIQGVQRLTPKVEDRLLPEIL